jgi:peptide/nickel transport system permease protein
MISTETIKVAEFVSRSRGRQVWYRLRRSPAAVSGTLLLFLLLALAFIGPLFNQWGYKEIDVRGLLKPPSARHWFGTTQIGQDVFAQTMRGLQKSLFIGVLVALFSALMASVVGISAGYFRGKVDNVLMWCVDLMLVLPSFLIIAILSRYVRSSSWLWLVLLLAVFYWQLTARLLRSLTLSLRELDYVKAAQFMGVKNTAIMRRHILPNLASLLIIDTSLTVGAAILGESGLSFFGFGVQPPDVSLGSLIATGNKAALTSPWLFMFAGGLLVLAVLAVNLIGDGLRDAFDPSSSQRSSRRQRRERQRDVKANQ